MQITVVGLGYVGLVTATCLARLGQEVIGLEADASKVDALERGETPYYEPHLEGELSVQRADRRLRFTLDASLAFRQPDAILICVGTPSKPSGDADLAAVHAVTESIAHYLGRRTVIALRSTVPVGTTRDVEGRLNAALAERDGPRNVPVLANPEFLRTGRAIEDFLHPSRVVLGRTETAAEADVETLATLYRPLEAPIFVVDAESAELVKNAANSYLATRISFVNELAALCEVSGTSIDAVIEGIAADPRIGGDYLRPGIGYGGSCLPKDVRSMMAMGANRGMQLPLVAAVDAVNASQPARAATRLAAALGGSLEGRRIALLGLAFKADTDDIRDSPALALAAILRREGAQVVACDPQAADLVRAQEPWIELADGPLEAATGADAAILATEWPEYVTMDLRGLAGAMRGALLLDARNALDASHVVGAGLTYMGVGRPGVRPEAQLS
jgi:UDPglucose 6-dehydrogenase